MVKTLLCASHSIISTLTAPLRSAFHPNGLRWLWFPTPHHRNAE